MPAAKEQLYNVVDHFASLTRGIRLYHSSEMQLDCGCRIHITQSASVCNVFDFPARTQKYIKDMGVPNPVLFRWRKVVMLVVEGPPVAKHHSPISAWKFVELRGSESADPPAIE
jgi:hypothetical protein